MCIILPFVSILILSVKAAETITYEKMTSVEEFVPGEKYVLTMSVTPLNQRGSRTVAMKTTSPAQATYNLDYYDSFDISTSFSEEIFWTIESYGSGYSLKAEGINEGENYLNILNDRVSLGNRQVLTITTGTTNGSFTIKNGEYFLRFTNSFNPGNGIVSAFVAGTNTTSSEFVIYKSSSEESKVNEPFDKGDLIKTVACISDIHIDAGIEKRNPPLRQSFINTCEAIAREEEASTILIGGDTTSSHYGASYTKEVFQDVKTAVHEQAKSATTTGYVIYANGNHDYSPGDGKDFNSGDYTDVMRADDGEFTDALYSDEACEKLLAYHYVLCGINYVVLNTQFTNGDNHSNYVYTQEGINWVKDKLEDIGKEKLTIFLSHYPLRDSRNISASGKGMEQGTHNSIKDIIKQYPNLIHVYGHDHGGSYIYNDTFERVTPYTLTGNVINNKSSIPTGFVSSYMGSMSQYGTDTGYNFGSGESPVIQALMIYVYENSIELQMKNYGTKTMPKDIPESYIYPRDIVLDDVEVTYRAKTGGKIKTSDDILKTEVIQKVNRGESTKGGITTGVTAEPEEGYRFLNWTTDGENATTDITRTDANVTTNKIVTANFEPIAVKTITLTPSSSIAMKLGETLKIASVISPQNALYKDEVIWKTSKEGIVELSPVGGDKLSVRVKGIATGTVMVTATAKDDVAKPKTRAIAIIIKNNHRINFDFNGNGNATHQRNHHS